MPSRNEGETRQTRGNRHRFRLHAVLFGVGVALLVGILASIGPGRIAEALRTCDPRLVVLAGLVYVAGQIVRGTKWYLFLLPAQPGAGLFPVVGCYLTNAFFSNITPGRSGEIVAPLLLHERCGTPKSLGLAVLLVDRLLDVLMLCGLLVTTVAVVALREAALNELTQGLWTGLAVLATGTAAALVIWRLSKAWRPASSPNGWPGRLHGALTRLHGAVDLLLAHPRRLAAGFVLTAVSWGLDLVSQFLMINAVVSISLVDNAICQVTASVAALVSFVPGGLGVATASHALVASQLGYSWDLVATGSLLNLVVNQALRWLMATIAGLDSRRRVPRD